MFLRHLTFQSWTARASTDFYKPINLVISSHFPKRLRALELVDVIFLIPIILLAELEIIRFWLFFDVLPNKEYGARSDRAF